MKNRINLALGALSLVVLTACGGGSSSTVSPTPTGFRVEGGLAQKGPLLKGSRVSIAELNPLNYAPAGPGYDLLTTDNMGGFSSSGINFTRRHIQTLAQGYYFNEISGEVANDTVLLQAQGDLTIDRLVNVNLLTTLAAPRIVALMTDKTKSAYYRNFAASRTQAQKEVLAAFRIYNGADMMSGDTDLTTVTVPANFNELDIAKDATPNKILVALSALVMQIGGNGVGVSQFIANFQLDLKDDGLINGTAGSSALQTSINTASAAVNLSTVATNLNTFYAQPFNLGALTSSTTYSAAQLTPWVDSSGGVDLVVDKFKSISTTAVVGTVSKSALAYGVGSDDAGTCFSVGSVSSVSGTTSTATTAATGTLYVTTSGATANANTMATTTENTAPVLVTQGQSVVLGLTATAAGSYAGFMQRSALPSSGVCPTATPTSGTTRVQKYGITATAAATAPGAPTSVVATAGAGQASVAFTPPASTGSSAITGYTASCLVGTTETTRKTVTGTISPIAVTGLTNGSEYSCTVTASNSTSTSVTSSVAKVTPVAAATVPGAPSLVSVTAAAGKATVKFTAPTSNGGSAITGYDASCVNGTTTKTVSTTTTTATSIVVTPLSNGLVYTCSAQAKNAVGSSLVSASAVVVPGATTTTKPGVPTVTSVTAGVGQITVAFTKAATSTTAGAATGFIATCTPTGSAAVVATGASTASSIVVTGLTVGASYTCVVGAYNTGGMNTTTLSNALSSTPTAASTTVTYSTPANFAAVIAKTYTPTTSLTASTTVTNRGYYMISDTGTTPSYATISSGYSAAAGYTVASGTLTSTATYNDYLTKTMQLVKAGDGYYRIDSYLHPNNSIDWGGSVASPTLKFVNNFGKTITTGNGFVTFDVTVNATTKVATLQAKNRYTYATTATVGTTGSTSYAGSYTKDTVFAGASRYVKLTGTTYSLETAATSFYLYTSPLNLGIPTFMDPMTTSFVTQAAAPFLNKVSTTAAYEAKAAAGVNSTYSDQVSASGASATTKPKADARLALIKNAVEANNHGSLRYAPALYTAFRDALLANTLVSDSISDGTPGQNLVPYVYFTNEMDSSGVYHPFMVVVNYGNQASPNGLKDVPSPPCSGTCGTAVTRFSNLEQYTTMIPMRNYGQVSAVTENATLTTNLWSDASGKVGTTVLEKNVYTYADTADNGLLIDGSVMFPAFNNTLVPSHLRGELSASGCHVGQGGGGPHCHADGYQSGKGLGLYNDADYDGKTHPPLIGFGYDGIALFGQYRSVTDKAMLGYDSLDAFGSHDHDSIGYHYHAHTVVDYQPVGLSTSSKSTMHVLMKGAYIGKIDTIPYFRSRTNNSLTNNKYMGGQ